MWKQTAETEKKREKESIDLATQREKELKELRELPGCHHA